jgi:hypothetical protein
MRVRPPRHITYIATLIVTFVAVLALAASPALAAHTLRPGAHGRVNVLADMNATGHVATGATAGGSAVVRRAATSDGAVAATLGVSLGLTVALLSLALTSSRRKGPSVTAGRPVPAVQEVAPPDAADAGQARKAA